MKPLIGITCDFQTRTKEPPKAQLDQRYVESVEEAGGIPVLLPLLKNLEEIDRVLSRIDALILSGGDDLDPGLYGDSKVHSKTTLIPKEKAAFDLAITKTLTEQGLPTLGICYGMQLLVVASGGKLHQHIPDNLPGAKEHQKSEHRVHIEGGSRLQEILGSETIFVHSAHHQAVREAGNGFKIVARSEDGIIEAIEGLGENFLFGIQWHPERTPRTPSLFRALVKAAVKKHKA